VGGSVLDVAAALRDEVFAEPSLNSFMARGRAAWVETQEALGDLLSDTDRASEFLLESRDVTMMLPFQVADYVDFYSSRHHAENVGRIFRPDAEALPGQWTHLPIGYHGRAGTVVVSGTDIVRPCGQRLDAGKSLPSFGPSQRLDIEAEVGFVVGVGSDLGEPVPVEHFREHVFGVVLLNDWSARDIQAYEYVPLGPFLGKSFATSISPWVMPLDAFGGAWTPPPPRTSELAAYLQGEQDVGLDLSLAVTLNNEVISRPEFRDMYWTPAQQMAHMTVNGARLRTGDLFASGTVSGAARDQWGSLLEMTWNGRDPLSMSDGSTRVFLEDGDTVSISASAPGPDGTRLDLGVVSGTIKPARG
jgi:fumarylacetoacetase